MKLIFWLTTACSSIAAILIYGVYFDSFSETELIGMSAFWFLPFIFGIYGLVAMRFMPEENADNIYQQPAMQTQSEVVPQPLKNPRLAQAVGRAVGRIPILGILILLLMLPLLAGQKIKSPFLMALLATSIWAGLLFVFFAVIFPAL